VARVRSNAKLALAAVVGAAAGLLLSRRRRPAEAPPAPPDRRADELRAKLAEARAAVADESDFEAAGMGAETLVEEPAPTQPPLDYEQVAPPAAAEPAPAPEPEPKAPARERKKPAAPAEPPPADEFEAMRRRIHEEGRTAAEEMRRSAEKPDQA
jgi:hypothetical protein